jgi:hypothetical protein
MLLLPLLSKLLPPLRERGQALLQATYTSRHGRIRLE